jgi:hypothetical protein
LSRFRASTPEPSGQLARVREEDLMDRPKPAQSRELTFDELEDAQDLRAVITAALAATPIDVEPLRRGVWTYVRAERDMGTSPAAVIVALSALVDSAKLQPQALRESIMRDVILWCVEAYFGYLGGQVVGGRA